MSIAEKYITHQFFKAAKDDPSLVSQPPSVPVDMRVLDFVFRPMDDLLAADIQYAGAENVNLSDKIGHMRQVCLEAQAAHMSPDPLVKQDRVELLNTLQTMSECVADSELAGQNDVTFTHNQGVLSLNNLIDTIKGDADIYGQFLGNTCVADALYDIVHNIEDAQSVKWQPTPTMLIDQPEISANDDSYHEELTA